MPLFTVLYQGNFFNSTNQIRLQSKLRKNRIFKYMVINTVYYVHGYVDMTPVLIQIHNLFFLFFFKTLFHLCKAAHVAGS